MSESEVIDVLLEFYVLKPNGLSLKLDDDEARQLYAAARQKMIAYDLVELTGTKGFYRATQKGYEAYYGGGFDKWLADNKRREQEAYQATLDSAKATVNASVYARHSKNAAWVAVVLTVVAILLSAYQIWKSEQQSSQIDAQTARVNALYAKVDTLYSQGKARSQSPTAKAALPQTRKKK